MKHTLLTVIKILVVFLFGITIETSAATFVVDNNADTDNLATYTLGDGTNTLRKCIRLANANLNNPTIDVINFNLGGVGPFTILLSGNLPVISEPVQINGFSQTGALRPNPYIMISATGAAAAASPINNIFFLSATASNSTISGFSMVRTQNDAIYLNGATNCFIEGCWIGLDQSGAQPVQANSRIGGHGLFLTNFANNCTIGGVNGRNVISGNTGHGVVLISSSGVSFFNNYIGTSTNGNTAIGNGIHGITLESSTSVVVGSTNPLESNLISGNTVIGLNIDINSNNYKIIGNRIGTNLAGTASLGNGSHGVNVSRSTFGVIGGITTSASNLISGNGGSGLVVFNGSSFCQIKGNKVGVNGLGNASIPNGVHGISIYTNTLNLTIGGANLNEGNLVSGNLFYGINIDDNSHNANIQGNKIGTDITGNTAIGNGNHGIFINVSTGTSIGGSTKWARNIIAGNGNAGGENGIAIQNSNYNMIKGNFIGISYSGIAALGNYDTGISFANSSNNTLGGYAFMERNVVSGHSGPGGNIGIWADNIDNSYFLTNYVGTDSTGMVALKNNNHGIYTQNGSDNNYFISNIISGNGRNGLDLTGLNNSFFYGNYIGLGRDGLTQVQNEAIGFRLGGASYNKIGGSLVSQRNYISGNGDHAFFTDGASTYNTFQGNYVGTDTSGLVAIGNRKSGVFFLDNSNYNLVGGTNAGQGNLICCSINSDEAGVRSQISANTTVVGNLIGTNKNAQPLAGFGNAGMGIWLMSYSYLGTSSSYAKIGGLLAGEANTITNNGRNGIQLSSYGGDFGTRFIPIIGNKIYCNGGQGINFETNSIGENEAIASPNVVSSGTNSISGTGTTGNVVHIYRNSYTDGARCDCEGEIYVGAVTVVGGIWSYTHNLGLNASQALAVTATQTNPSNSTSKFWVCSSPLPVDFLKLQVFRNKNIVNVQFEVRNEYFITKYIIQRSKDGVVFENVGTVIAKNNQGSTTYTFDDIEHLEGNVYYRIKTIEVDGKAKNSDVVLLQSSDSIQATLFPNPATQNVTINLLNLEEATFDLINAEGRILMNEVSLKLGANSLDISILPAGVYVVLIKNQSTSVINKLVVNPF